MTETSDGRLPLSRILFYSLPFSGYLAMSMPVGMWFAKFSTDQLLITPAVVGAILITADPDEIGPEMFAHLRGAVRRVVQTVDELFDQEVMLAQRSSELSILFRLSSLLVAAHDIEEIFRVALRSAVDILGVDGAMVHLREGDTREHVLRASVEIPEESLAELVTLCTRHRDVLEKIRAER